MRTSDRLDDHAWRIKSLEDRIEHLQKRLVELGVFRQTADLPRFTWPARAMTFPEQIEAFILKAMLARPPDTDINTWELGEIEHVVRDGLWVLTVEWKPVLR